MKATLRDTSSTTRGGTAGDDAREELVKAALLAVVLIVFAYAKLWPWPDMLCRAWPAASSDAKPG